MAHAADRTHNSHRYQQPEHSDEVAARAYRGVHRGESMHRADEARTAAMHRSSRPGRHHADPDHLRNRR